MKKFFFILLLIPIVTIGQVNTDSLWGVWQDDAQEDTTRLTAVNDYIWSNYLFSQPDSAFYFAELAYSFAKEKGQQQHMAIALNSQGISYHMRGNYSEANDYYQKALRLNEEINNLTGISSTLSNIGLSYREQGDYYSAIRNLNKSLVIAEELGDKNGIKKTLNNIGLIYLDLNNNKTALDYLKRSMITHGAKEEEIKNLGAMVNIGVIYNKKGEYQAALKSFEKALKVYKKVGDKRGMSACLNNIGRAHLHLKNTTTAINQLNQSLNLSQEIADKNGTSLTMFYLANIYFEMGNIDSAHFYGQNAFDLAQETGAVKNIANASEINYKILKLKGHHQVALEMLELNIASNDKIKNTESEREVIRLEYQYEFDKKILEEKNIEKLSRMKERYLILTGLLLLLLLIGLIIRRRYLRHSEERSQMLHEMELLKEKSRVKMVATDTTAIPKTTLDKEKISAAANGKLNDSDWKILNVIYDDPILVNRLIAEEVALSLEGASSSLKKMYKLFNITNSKNKKIALVMEVVRLSGE